MFLMWQCGSALWSGRKLSDAAVQRFHQQLNAAEYQAICNDADEGFRSGQNQEDIIKLLTAVHKKLGAAGKDSLINLEVKATTNGTFTTAFYDTKFANGDATETFTWIKSGGGLKLYGYNIQSMALIVN